MLTAQRQSPVKTATAIVALAVLLRRRRTLSIRSLLALLPSVQMLVGVGVITLIEKWVAKLLKDAGFAKIPATLVTMISILLGLKGLEVTAGKSTAEGITKAFSPASTFLTKYMTVWLAPPLASLPVSLKTLEVTSATWAKLGALHGVAWLISITFNTMLSEFLSKSKKPKATSEPAADSSPGTSNGDTKPTPPPAKDPLLDAWINAMTVSYALWPAVGSAPATFTTTVASLLAANKLPAKVKSTLHPLLISAFCTILGATMMGKVDGADMTTSLKKYLTKTDSWGPGDAILRLLGPACCALGFKMFESRKVLEENLPVLTTTCLASSQLSLFGTSAAAGLVGIPQNLGLVLSQRQVMSALGIAGANILGADPSLAVASILVTGVYGASIGREIMGYLGVPTSSTITRGIAMGSTSHAIGTAALLGSEPDAAAVSSVALCLCGIFHTMALTFPAVQKTILGLTA